MRFAINTPNFGIFSDPRLMADLAHEAEESGWDGFFLWDHALWTWPGNQPLADPWLTLAAMAMTTRRIKLGPGITPVPRRRPWHLAREATTLDHLSGGRVVMGVGIGGDWFGDYSRFGEPADDKTHGEMLDEGLEILAGLWSGEPFSYEGKHYTIRDVQFLPRPVQQPRIPIWVAGRWPNKKPFRRAARWEGIVPLLTEEMPVTPADVTEMLAFINERRTDPQAPFDVLLGGNSTGDPAKDADTVAPFAEAGVTWWSEGFIWDHTIEQVRGRIRKGPPRL